LRDNSKLQEQLLAWYGRHRRVMPWRALKGKTPDPYHVWLSEIMLQQTTVVTVGPYFMKFITKWPTVKALAKAKLDDVLTAWAGLGYYARARNLHKCAQIITAEYNGKFPSSQQALMELPGIGPYTAAAISSIAFNQPAVAVDGNVERVVSRFFAIEEPLPASKETLRAHAAKLAEGNAHPGDFTQAFMELGATVCTPRKPKCGGCPWQKSCKARDQGIAEDLPRKTAKAKNPVRYGKVFWIQKNSEEFLIEKRTGKGLYEGLYQLPTTEWTQDNTETEAHLYDKQLRFKPLDVEVRHTFTHFDLVLEIWAARPGKRFNPHKGRFVSAAEIETYALPSLMQKVLKLCLRQKQPDLRSKTA
jgi:A/G-specific adenine glycosylase